MRDPRSTWSRHRWKTRRRHSRPQGSQESTLVSVWRWEAGESPSGYSSECSSVCASVSEFAWVFVSGLPWPSLLESAYSWAWQWQLRWALACEWVSVWPSAGPEWACRGRQRRPVLRSLRGCRRLSRTAASPTERPACSRVQTPCRRLSHRASASAKLRRWRARCPGWRGSVRSPASVSASAWRSLLRCRWRRGRCPRRLLRQRRDRTRQSRRRARACRVPRIARRSLRAFPHGCARRSP